MNTALCEPQPQPQPQLRLHLHLCWAHFLALNVLLAVLRLAHNKARPSLRGSLDSMMGWVERSVEHLPNLPRLHPKECIKRSICEAHNEPDKYGAVGVMLRLLFP